MKMPVLVKQLTSKLGYPLTPCGNTRQENFCLVFSEGAE